MIKDKQRSNDYENEMIMKIYDFLYIHYKTKKK